MSGKTQKYRYETRELKAAARFFPLMASFAALLIAAPLYPMPLFSAGCGTRGMPTTQRKRRKFKGWQRNHHKR